MSFIIDWHKDKDPIRKRGRGYPMWYHMLLWQRESRKLERMEKEDQLAGYCIHEGKAS